MPFNWSWALRPGRKNAPVEKKEAGYGFVALHAQGEARWTRRDYAGLAREGFMRNPVAHRSVRLISEAAASVPWLLYEGATEFERHPLIDLLDRPNQRQAGGAFMEALYGHLLLSGNAYVEFVSASVPPSGLPAISPSRGEIAQAAELHLLRPDRVTVATDAAGWPVALEYRAEAGKRSVALGTAAEGGALHLTLFHPLDDHYGFPPLEAALMALDIHNAAGRWNKALLDNSARPSGALVFAPKEGGNLTDEQFERLKVELEQGYSGAARAGRPLLLEGGLDWKAMGLTPKDMDFMEAKNGAARDIALAFGVPPMLLGIPGDNTYANYQEANRAFYRLTVLPLVTRTAKELSAWLGPVFGEELRLWFDADQIEGLAAERDALWSRLGAAGFLTDDEKREAVGYQPQGGLGTKAGFRPDQPRVPAGNGRESGRWADEGGQVIPVQSRTRGSRGGGGPRRIAGNWRDLTPEQETRLEISHSQMQAAVQRVRKVEPHWSPRPSAYSTVEGEIAANETATREAEARYQDLQRMGCVPGPYAAESLPARGPGRDFSWTERGEINRFGRKYGCHTCGATEEENYIPDHQPANRLNFQDEPQRLYPQCIGCSRRQGGNVSKLRWRFDHEGSD